MKDELIAILLRIISILLEEREEASPVLARRVLSLISNERLPEDRKSLIIRKIFDETFPE